MVVQLGDQCQGVGSTANTSDIFGTAISTGGTTKGTAINFLTIYFEAAIIDSFGEYIQ